MNACCHFIGWTIPTNILLSGLDIVTSCYCCHGWYDSQSFFRFQVACSKKTILSQIITGRFFLSVSIYVQYFVGLNIEVSSVCGVLAAMGVLVPGNDIAASALIPLIDVKNKASKNMTKNTKSIPKNSLKTASTSIDTTAGESTVTTLGDAAASSVDVNHVIMNLNGMTDTDSNINVDIGCDGDSSVILNSKQVHSTVDPGSTEAMTVSIPIVTISFFP